MVKKISGWGVINPNPPPLDTPLPTIICRAAEINTRELRSIRRYALLKLIHIIMYIFTDYIEITWDNFTVHVRQ